MQLDESPFEELVRAPHAADFSWDGEVDLAFEGRNLRGPGSVRGDSRELVGSVTSEDTELMEGLARRPVEIRLAGTPGVLLEENRYGTCRPVGSDEWVADRCSINGRNFGGLVNTDRFVCSSITEFGPAREGAVSFIRIVYASANIKSPSRSTFWNRDRGLEMRRDAVGGAFQGHRLVLRNLHHGDTDTPDQLVAAILECSALDDLQSEGLWMLVGFISGNRVTELYWEYFRSDGQLVRRVRRRGVPASIGRFEPFHSNVAPLLSDYITTIGDAFVRTNRAGFPMNVVLEHLHDANSGNSETDAQSLLLAIHTAIEAWNRSFGLNSLADEDVWTVFRDELLQLVAPVADSLGDVLAETVRNKIRSANYTSTNYRERDLFATLGITLSRADRAALAARNQLLHNGYFLRRFHQLTPAEQQVRVDTPPLLRNLVHQIILKCCGFSGRVMECSRYGALPIESLFSPLF